MFLVRSEQPESNHYSHPYLGEHNLQNKAKTDQTLSKLAVSNFEAKMLTHLRLTGVKIERTDRYSSSVPRKQILAYQFMSPIVC